jgi:hypothetical protein
LQVDLEAACRSGKGVASVLFDIDSFKAINDTRGYGTGTASFGRWRVFSDRQANIDGRLQPHDDLDPVDFVLPAPWAKCGFCRRCHRGENSRTVEWAWRG